MENLIIIAQGDTSDDGHGRTQKEFFMSNYNNGEVRLSYYAGCEALGFDPIKALDSQDYRLTQEQADKLNEMLLPDDEYFYLKPNERMNFELSYLYMRVAQIGNKDMKFEWLASHNYIIDIGCYDSV